MLATDVPDELREVLTRVQNELFDLGADLSVPFGVTDRLRVTHDQIAALEQDCDRFNADAHLRAMLLGHSLSLQVSGAKLVLGQWQRVLVAELDGPRARTLRV